MTFISQFTPYSFPLLGLVRLPEVGIAPEDKTKVGLKPTASNLRYLQQLTWNGYLKRRDSGQFTGFTEEQVKQRLRAEFDVFDRTGTADYFLLLADLARFCDEQKILRGRGRGSSAGSLAMSFLGITDINSLEHGLYFSRFLSEARLKPKVLDGVIYVDGKMAPDVDSDFEYLRRPEVIRYLEEKYQGRTCKISTRLQLTGKTALKDVLKAFLEYDETTAKRVTDHVEAQFGNVESLAKAEERHEELREWIGEHPSHRIAFDIARSLESLNTGKGQHPSGVFISYAPLDGNVPVELSKTKEVVSAFDMNVVATLGSKVDILGVRTLDCVNEVCKVLNIDPHSIDVNHPSIYDYLKRTNLYLGLFQISDGITKDTVHRIGPRNIDDLACLVAITRPGALTHIDQFKDFIQNGVVVPIHPKLDEILRPTGGVILFQEQITEVCVKVFGMPEIEADQVRYYVGKKLKDEMKKTEPILYEKGRERGIPEETIKYFWDTCNASADYLFVKSHAVSYAYLCAATVFLKANHPREFIFALLKLSKHEPDSQAVLNAIIAESKQIGIKILPPDIVKSSDDFSIEGDGVRFGLSHIRGISDTTMVKLTSFKRDFKTKFEIFEAAQEAKINISVLVGLILCGCIDSGGISRTKLAIEAQMYNLLTDRERNLVHKLAGDYGNDLIAFIKDIKTKTDEKGKPYIKESRLDTFRRDLAPYWKMYQDNSKHEELAQYLLERHYLGFSYSNTLHNLYSRKVPDLDTIAHVLTEPKDTKVSFVAFVGEFKKGTGKASGKSYVRFELTDETGQIKIMLNGDQKIQACEQFNGRLPKDGDIIICHGGMASTGGDMVFGDSIIIQQTHVSLRKNGEIETT
jgi:DNA polymerase-3 subunit alpha